jgi:hypothetical protein
VRDQRSAAHQLAVESVRRIFDPVPARGQVDVQDPASEAIRHMGRLLTLLAQRDDGSSVNTSPAALLSVGHVQGLRTALTVMLKIDGAGYCCVEGDERVPDLPKYHLTAQQADALLAPVNATVHELRNRIQHYLDRVTLESADADALEQAHTALATASREITRLLNESRQIARR